MVDAFLAGSEAPVGKVSGRAFNVAFGRCSTLNAVYAMLQEATGLRLPAAYAPARTGDVKHSHADVSAARKALGWEPRVTLEEGLKRTVAAAVPAEA